MSDKNDVSAGAGMMDEAVMMAEEGLEPKKKAKQGTGGPGGRVSGNYTPVQDLLIAKAFIAASENSVTGAAQKVSRAKNLAKRNSSMVSLARLSPV